MPLDSAPDRSLTLADRLGFTPIDPAFLAEHRTAMAKKHGPSWAWHHRRELAKALPLVALFGCSGLMFGAVLLGAGLDNPYYIAGMPLGFAWFVACAKMSIQLKLRGPARWHMRFLRDGETLPPAVETIRQRVAKRYGCLMQIGELRNEYALLDPYLLACVDGQWHCLAIWDGNTIIAIAQ
jgi:hypothetical protein